MVTSKPVAPNRSRRRSKPVTTDDPATAHAPENPTAAAASAAPTDTPSPVADRTIMTTIRIPETYLRRLDAHVRTMQRLESYKKWSRSQVLLQLIDRFLPPV